MSGNDVGRILARLQPGEELQIRLLGPKLARASVVDTRRGAQIAHCCHCFADKAIRGLADALDDPSGDHEIIRAHIQQCIEQEAKWT